MVNLVMLSKCVSYECNYDGSIGAVVILLEGNCDNGTGSQISELMNLVKCGIICAVVM